MTFSIKKNMSFEDKVTLAREFSKPFMFKKALSLSDTLIGPDLDLKLSYLISVDTILRLLEKTYPIKSKDFNWVLSKFILLHEELLDLFTTKESSIEESKDESELLKSLDFVNEMKKVIENSETSLGKKTEYIDSYNPHLLFPISRQDSRDRIGKFPFSFDGLDIWNSYEFSFLNLSGKPQNTLLRLGYSCSSKYMIESKSLKLYLNSFSQYRSTLEDVLSIIRTDLFNVLDIDDDSFFFLDVISGRSQNTDEEKIYKCIDTIESSDFIYEYDSHLLKTVSSDSTQTIRLYSNLLKSNCRHTRQPDWGSVFIDYIPSGLLVDEESLLKYIVSFRSHNEFHEECCERILYDLVSLLNPCYLQVRCKYVRRGGLDINPYRVYISPTSFHNSFYLFGLLDEFTFFSQTERQ